MVISETLRSPIRLVEAEHRSTLISCFDRKLNVELQGTYIGLLCSLDCWKKMVRKVGLDCRRNILISEEKKSFNIDIILQGVYQMQKKLLRRFRATKTNGQFLNLLKYPLLLRKLGDNCPYLEKLMVSFRRSVETRRIVVFF